MIGARQRQIDRQTQRRNDPLDEPLRRHVAKSVADEIADIGLARRRLVQRYRAAERRMHADNGFAERAFSGVQQAADAQDFTSAHIERDVREFRTR